MRFVEEPWTDYTAYQMEGYREGGAPQRFEYVDDPDTLSALHSAASEALSSAVALNVYLARYMETDAR